MKPRVFLITRLNDPNPDQEELRRLKLEPEAQKYFESLFTPMDNFNSSRSLLHTLLATGWLLKRGRKVRFEIEVGGEVHTEEVKDVKELDELIGDGKTLSTLVQALGSAGPASKIA